MMASFATLLDVVNHYNGLPSIELELGKKRPDQYKSLPAEEN
jgi:hypothetical protein